MTQAFGAVAAAPRRRRFTLPESVGTWPLLAFLGVLFVWPAAAIIGSAFTEPPGAGLANFRRLFADPTFTRFAANTVRTAVVVTVFTGGIGYFYAFVLYVSGRRLRTFLMNCALLPFWTSLLVRSFAWSVLLRDTGVVNWALLRLGLVSQPLEMLRTPFAVTLGMTQILLPFVILPTFAGMVKFDVGLLRAARSLGAGPAAAFRLVFFPATRAGLTAGIVLVFVLSLGYYITPVLLGGPSDQPIAVLINSQVVVQLNWGVAGAMSAIVTAATLALLAACWGVAAKSFFA